MDAVMDFSDFGLQFRPRGLPKDHFVLLLTGAVTNNHNARLTGNTTDGSAWLENI